MLDLNKLDYRDRQISYFLKNRGFELERIDKVSDFDEVWSLSFRCDTSRNDIFDKLRLLRQLKNNSCLSLFIKKDYNGTSRMVDHLICTGKTVVLYELGICGVTQVSYMNVEIGMNRAEKQCFVDMIANKEEWKLGR